MSKRINKVLTPGDFLSAAVWLTVIYFASGDILSFLFDSGTIGRIYVFSMLFVLLMCALLSGRIPKIKINNLLWVLALMIVLITSRENIESNNLFWATIYISLIVLIVMAEMDARWTKKCWKTVISVGRIFVGATILLFIFSPWLYNATMLNFWGRIPGGCTANDAYKAGLASHYSGNSIYCSITLILMSTKLIVSRSNKVSGRDVAAVLLTLLALLLTTKRGPLLFAMLAIVVTYYVCNPKSGITKGFYIIAAIVSALIIFFLLAPFVPLFGNILSRFVDAEDISSNRFLFWEQAYSLFLENKLWGIGWGQYVRRNMYGTSAHNIYIQLLCETGIVGFAVFTIAMIGTYVTAVKDYKKHSKHMPFEYRQALASSLAIQIFVIAYGFTGNCLYDMTVFVYFISCAASLAIHYALRRMKVNKAES